MIIRKTKQHHLAMDPGTINISTSALESDHPVAADLPVDPDLSLESAASPRPARGFKSWKWLLVGINLCALLGGVAAAAFLWLMALPPAPECDKLTSLSPDIDHLSCAETAAQSGELQDLLAGLDMLETWTPDRPLYREAQRLVDDWSEQLLYRARRQIEAGNLAEAQRLVQAIPPSSAAYDDGQAIVNQWKTVWQEGAAIAVQVQTALKQQNWMEASYQIRALEQMPHAYWRSHQSVLLSRRVWHERKARKRQQDALKQARSGQLPDLEKALAIATQMQPDTYAYQDMQPLLNQWSIRLLEAGRQHWKATRLDQAIALAEQVKQNPAMAAEAEHLIWLSQARRLALASGVRWYTSPQHIYHLQEAIAAARRVPQGSRFYAQAQDSLISWQQQVDDLKRLQMAQLIANLGTIDTYKAAIAQVETIAPNRQRRLQAQTLAAHWREEIERLEDAPILAHARRLAEPGTIPALKLAIAAANQIPLGRAGRGNAQAWVYQWTAQIQKIEDQPFLTLAQTQARQGKLTEAIRTASVIRPGRFHYAIAQASIRQWRGQIQQDEARRRRAVERSATPTSRPAASSPRSSAPPTAPSRSPATLDRPVNSGTSRRPAPPPPPAPPASTPAPTPREVVQPLYAPLQSPESPPPESPPEPSPPSPPAPSPTSPPPAAAATPEPTLPPSAASLE